jgi:large subunit ribosomal protein L10
MPKTRAQKTEALDQLKKAFKEGKSVTFADYQGMKVTAMADLRKQLRGQQVEYMVAKKTLLSIAAKEAGYEVNFKSLPGMVGAAFAFEDEMAGTKVIGDAGKDGPIKLVGGIFEGKFVDQNYVITLSKLPSKNQLLSQLLSVLNGPTSAFARLLNAYKDTLNEGKPAEAAPAPAAESAPAEAPAPAAETAPEVPAVTEAPAAPEAPQP